MCFLLSATLTFPASYRFPVFQKDCPQWSHWKNFNDFEQIFIIRGFFKSMFVWKQTWIEVSALNKLPLCYNWTFIKGSFLKLPEPLICHFNSTELLSKVGFRNYLNHSLTSSSLLLVFEQRKVTSSSVSMLHPNVVYQLLLYPKLTNYNKLKLESRSTGNLC